MIGITQPRRVAATSTAARVAYEMGDSGLQLNPPPVGRRKHRERSDSSFVASAPVQAESASTSVTKSCRLKSLKSPLDRKRKPLRSYLPILPQAACTEPYDTSVNIQKHADDAHDNLTGTVGYQVRFDSATVRDTTRILFMTDGILLREISSDLLLRKYSVIILDEAHERNVNTDILLGMLSRAVPLRRELSDKETKIWSSMSVEDKLNYEEPIAPLKLIIMSATLRIDDFKNPVLFPSISPPVITVEARQYPVVTHFARKTEVANYLKETYNKVCQIHRRLPAGGILVFLTGKREILHMCRKLAAALGHASKAVSRGPLVVRSQQLPDKEADLDEDDIEAEMNANLLGDDEFNVVEESNDLGASWNPDNDGDDSDTEAGESDEFQVPDEEVLAAGDHGISKMAEDAVALEPTGSAPETGQSVRAKMLAEAVGTNAKAPAAKPSAESSAGTHTSATGNEQVGSEEVPLRPVILPLYAMMTPFQQARVFQEMPAGTRLIIVATNVAETSITIPGIRYVVDCGRQKVKTLQSSTGIRCLQLSLNCLCLTVSCSLSVNSRYSGYLRPPRSSEKEELAELVLDTAIDYIAQHFSISTWYSTRSLPYFPPLWKICCCNLSR
jgi:HrpA-like RNA helicase